MLAFYLFQYRRKQLIVAARAKRSSTQFFRYFRSLFMKIRRFGFGVMRLLPDSFSDDLEFRNATAK